jgi:soluble lytic murein transglycosylase-like protein
MSYGLMQIMGLTAVEFGFAGRFLTELLEPSAALEFGCRKLRHAMDKTSNDVTKALLMYNGGSDAAYPTRVLPRVAKYSS